MSKKADDQLREVLLGIKTIIAASKSPEVAMNLVLELINDWLSLEDDE